MKENLNNFFLSKKKKQKKNNTKKQIFKLLKLNYELTIAYVDFAIERVDTFAICHHCWNVQFVYVWVNVFFLMKFITLI